MHCLPVIPVLKVARGRFVPVVRRDLGCRRVGERVRHPQLWHSVIRHVAIGGSVPIGNAAPILKPLWEGSEKAWPTKTHVDA